MTRGTSQSPGSVADNLATRASQPAVGPPPSAWPSPALLGRLHLITDESLQHRFSHAELARLAVAGGADVIQFREKRPLRTRELVAAAVAVAERCRAQGALCIVDDRADVALAAGASGVHVGRDDLSPAAARRILGPQAIVGATVHDLEELRAVSDAPINYIGVGPVFGTKSKDTGQPPLGLDGLACIARRAPVPVIALGNILPENVADVLAAGAFGIAVLSGICLAEDPTGASARYREAIARVSSEASHV
jgi:thiamine-phosphate pyrophosphorylase